MPNVFDGWRESEMLKVTDPQTRGSQEDYERLLCKLLMNAFDGNTANNGSVFDALVIAIAGNIDGIYSQTDEDYSSSDDIFNGDADAPYSLVGGVYAIVDALRDIAAAIREGNAQR